MNANFEGLGLNQEMVKRCPFCGGEPQLVRNITDFGVYYYIECIGCGSRTKGHCATFKQFDDSALDWINPLSEKALRIWERRV